MNLYPHDCSYLFTEYGKRKSQECYDIEMKERRLDDGEQETEEAYSRSSAPDNKGRLKR